jgi:hypothetical protein
MKPKHYRYHQVLGWTGLVSGVLVAALILSFIAVQSWPVIGAQGADFLRGLIGDQAVAGLEMKFNQIQDGFQRLKYQLGLDTPSAPWNTTPAVFPTVLFVETSTSTSEIQTPVEVQPTATSNILNPPEPTPTPTPAPWQPAAVAPMAAADGEGVWSAYIQDAAGNTVAYRTFLQPDPSRPYTLVAIVAIDLTHTRLHFVLGSEEPAGTNTQPRSGAIPKPDRVPNVLLAAFNGGFKARHGQFGAMAGGVVALQPRNGLGTLVMYADGRVSLGEWGPGSTITPDMTALRQNGPLVIQDGQVSQRIHNNSPEDWGYTVNDVSPTVRTGVGLSKDAKTLYYFCGPSLSMEALATSMDAAGAWNAIQLDINNYWALFVKFNPSKSNVIPEPLLPRLMVANVERYLWDYTRDYFYITSTVR